jgi:16S rRNA (uracil1498-N3)-methyltransferase
MADRFYTNSALCPGPFILQGAEAHHLATVRRFRPGDRVHLFNGDGAEYPADIVSLDKKSVALEVVGVERPVREHPFRCIAAAPLPKGDRGDFMIEKLTELGATDFVPLRTEHSIVVPRETKLDRLKRAVIEASKQCGRNVLMRIHELTAWDSFLGRPDLPALRLLAHPEEREPVPEEMGSGDLCFAAGPEGGFTSQEVTAARKAGWRCVTLGPRVLRVETAAIALAAACGVARGR